MLKQHRICYLLLLSLLCCKKPYAPSVITSNANYLIVEGTINTGQDSTIIKLSRTVMLSSSVVANPELNASVSVVSHANAIYPLTETGNGYYAAPALNLSATNTYSLRIATSNGKIYQSDFLQVKNSPPIDSVNYLVQNNVVQVNVNTHDPGNKTIYYRWNYVETYVIHSHYDTQLEVQTVPFDTVVIRPASHQIHICWPSDTSSTIILSSSAKLKQDVISQKEIITIPFSSDKLAYRYSILVKQYALTPDAYNYWQLLKKNTEQLGSIFDAQPSELPGNIHCITTPSEPVIGYLSAGTVSQVRIFIDRNNLPALHSIIPLSIDNCDSLEFLFNRKIGFNQYVNDIPIWIYSGKQYPYKIIGSIDAPAGYMASDRFCVDCTLRGPNIQPSFWTN